MTNDRSTASRRVRVQAPCRLHCGLLSIRGAERRFGGAGLMVESPRVQVSVVAAEQFCVTGQRADRAREFAVRWSRFSGRADVPPCQLAIESVPPQHVGLGSGTQLALSVATALSVWCNDPPLSPSELAASVGRGDRSAIGTYGFCGGGFVVDRGKAPTESLAELDCRVAVPTAWRFVLIRPQLPVGLSGPGECQIFEREGPEDFDRTAHLRDELRRQLLPAVVRADFEAFSDSLYQYGHNSGLLFAREQQGPYNGPVLQRLVELIRGLQVRGVAQSSWGPTLFAALPHESAAQQFVQRLQAATSDPLTVEITAADNHGARVERHP